MYRHSNCGCRSIVLLNELKVIHKKTEKKVSVLILMH